MWCLFSRNIFTPARPPSPPGYSWGIRYRQAYPPLYPHAPGVRCPIVCAISSATSATDRQRCSIGLRRAARAAKCFLTYSSGPVWAIFDQAAVDANKWPVRYPYIADPPNGTFFKADTLAELGWWWATGS